ncbi:neutral and basic amino acid transport protein rBAT-like isoform X2 [Osmia bicornis bicornis]|uniref:neutral and basic amino acid transport protein rBAT-like isoform X2 n=1 Tax=Osmia bicornis bicornis TaxID=1437191 RepID=UPI001EAF2D7B|nr:neutral and basic amino acid transport protein rBAT-like isoform X2 [Osmia bicornis bicornis]
MNIQKPEGLLSVVLPTELASSVSSRQLIINQDQQVCSRQTIQDEEASDCPLLTPSPPGAEPSSGLESGAIFVSLEGNPVESIPPPTLENINKEDGLNEFMNIVNSSSRVLNDEPSSRDPMVESTSSGSSSDTNGPVCAQLLTQLNTAYQHLAPDAQALENGGKPPLVGIQLVVPKPSKDYRFMKWNWPLIRKTCFWSLMSVLAGCTALVIGVIATMPRKCDPTVQWWQGSVFYEIFPASFQDSSKGGDGIGDIRGIAMRLDYLKELGIRGIRLNSIFPAAHYPEYYSNIDNLTDLNEHLGTLDDFATLVRQVHRRNMSLLLDLPLYPFVKTLVEDDASVGKINKTEKAVRFERERRDVTDNDDRDDDDPVLQEIIPTTPSMSVQAIREALSSIPPPLDQSQQEALFSNPLKAVTENSVTIAIRTWLQRGVDGFYLKGLEHYVDEDSFASNLKHWKSILGSERILICHVDALNAAKSVAARNSILTRIDLLDVTLRVANGTKQIKRQVEDITRGVLFEKAGYPWVHWSIGGVDSARIASTISVKNATMAATLLGMMLPGTPSIFYGDEIGIVDCECEDHKDLSHVHNLAPMYWEKNDGSDNKFASIGVTAWLPEATKPLETSLMGTIAEMADLRSQTTPIYVKAVLKQNQVLANCDIRYADDEMIVIERWYPRRNSYVFVANLGNETQTKDLSFLYYGGHVVVGPTYRLNRDVYFKELIIPPGEAFVIKLDK